MNEIIFLESVALAGLGVFSILSLESLMRPW